VFRQEKESQDNLQTSVEQMQREHVSNGSSLNEISKQSLSMSMENLVAERTPMTYFRETWFCIMDSWRSFRFLYITGWNVLPKRFESCGRVRSWRRKSCKSLCVKPKMHNLYRSWWSSRSLLSS
jgi:hypothetical protein